MLRYALALLVGTLLGFFALPWLYARVRRAGLRWKPQRPAGRYVCSSPKCGWVWYHDGAGRWQGPHYPNGERTTSPRTRTWSEMEAQYEDCAPRLVRRDEAPAFDPEWATKRRHR